MIMYEHAWVKIGLFGSEKGEFFARFRKFVIDFCTINKVMIDTLAKASLVSIPGKAA